MLSWTNQYYLYIAKLYFDFSKHTLSSSDRLKMIRIVVFCSTQNSTQSNQSYSRSSIKSNKYQLNMHMYVHLIAYWLSNSFQQMSIRWWQLDELYWVTVTLFSFFFSFVSNKLTCDTYFKCEFDLLSMISMLQCWVTLKVTTL